MFSIGGVALADNEAINGTIPAPGNGPQRWVFGNPYGLKGRIKQYTGQDAGEIDIHWIMTEATRAALQAVSDTRLPTVVMHDRAPLGVLMTMTVFLPVWDKTELGDAWDTHIVLVEE